MANNEQLEQTLTGMLRNLVARPDNTTFAARLRSADIHIMQVFVRIDPHINETREEQRARQTRQYERLIELMRTASRYVKWDDFVFTCSSKIDVTGTWMTRIAEATKIDSWDIRYRKATGTVPTEWIEKVLALPDWTPQPERRSNFNKIAVKLVAALRSSGKSSSWIATTLTDFLRDFDATKVTTSDVTMTPRM
jgi:hypothetical protein